MAQDHDDVLDPTEPKRRDFLARASRLAMAAGLAGGYSMLGAIAVRFLYPARPDNRDWQFVMELERLRPGESMRYQSPAGQTVNITRQGETGDADDFIALSSTCPHLGCQVHWESQRDRYFCPCHNGTFDASGRGTGGPPGDAGQSLPRYPLQVQGGLLYILVPTQTLTGDATEPASPGGAVDPRQPAWLRQRARRREDPEDLA